MANKDSSIDGLTISCERGRGNCVCTKKYRRWYFLSQFIWSQQLGEVVIYKNTFWEKRRHCGTGHHWSGPFLYSVVFTAHFWEFRIYNKSHKICPGIVPSRAAIAHQSDENQWEFCIVKFLTKKGFLMWQHHQIKIIAFKQQQKVYYKVNAVIIVELKRNYHSPISNCLSE